MVLQLDNRVCIVWRDDPHSIKVNALIFKSDRKVRAFLPDAVDPRAGEVPVMREEDKILDFLKAANPNTRIAVPVPVAIKMFGWKREDFAEA